ncbi:MAG: hypothetical protein AAF741_07090 [Bacteroidota bacterium]
MSKLHLSWRICLLNLLIHGYALGQTSVASAAYEQLLSDQSIYYVLGCKHQGWSGYFALDNWYETVRSGDGGVDVTEAPNAMVAEGASAARLVVQTYGNADYALRITVPADGYLYFRLKKVGSFLSPRIRSTATDIFLLINGARVALKLSPSGSYYSPFLKSGSTFGIEFINSEGKYHLEDISYYSNSSGVWVSRTGQTEGWSPYRVRPVDRPRLNQIYFSFDRPEEWPTIDLDGDLLTFGDQTMLSEHYSGPFNISYTDKQAIRNGQFWIKRTFNIAEPCSGNQIAIERWWIPIPLIHDAEGVKK